MLSLATGSPIGRDPAEVCSSADVLCRAPALGALSVADADTAAVKYLRAVGVDLLKRLKLSLDVQSRSARRRAATSPSAAS